MPEIYIASDEQLTDIADAIREKGGTEELLEFPDGFVSAIQNIPSGGGGGASKNDVTFYDYDGTIIASCSASDFASVSALPDNPSHEGLVAQGWNWSLADAQDYVASYGKLNIGQMYVTQSGATEIDVEMHEVRLSPILTICVNGSITVDWGDGTTPDTVTGMSLTVQQGVPHTYASEGNYTISILATENNKYSFCGTGNCTILRKNTSRNENVVYTIAVKHIRIGNNADIDSAVFSYCYSLTSITIPNSVTIIGNMAFYNCTSLSGFTIPDSVTNIGNQTFEYCYSLTSVPISYSVTSIGTNVFNECYSLSSITIPEGVTSFGGAFYSCYSLTSVTMPDSVTTIDGSTFGYCYSLTSIAIPDSVTSIGTYAFNSCYSLTSITIPEGVTSIGNNAFYCCYGAKEFHVLPTTVPTGGTNMFTNTPSDCIIYVPQGHYWDYYQATNWSTFKSKIQIEPT